MHNGTGDDLAERSANAHRRADGPEREIKAARALREVGDHEHRDNAEYCRHTIQSLDRDQQQRLSPPRPRLPPRPGSQQRDHKLLVTTHADMNIIEFRP
jgi:hypothetical protein